MNIELCNSPDNACDAFAARMPQGKICHLYAWNAALRDSGLQPYYLVARDGGAVHGVLPLVHVKSVLFGNFMVSQGMSNYGGPLANSDAARDALFNHAVDLATKLGCDSIEFRNIEPLPYDLQLRTGKMCMHLPLDGDPDKIWNALDAKVRNQVRKAEKSDIVAEHGGPELFESFYEIFSIRMHQLGTPVFSKYLLLNLVKAFPNNSRIFVVRLGSSPVGAAVIHCFNGFVEIPYAGTLVRYNNLCPNMLLYWSVIKHYCLAGASTFDFGRCTVDGPTYKFKKQWNPAPVDLHYQYWVRPGHKLSILSPDNQKYRRKIEMWKKLPLWLARLIGPTISRNLP